MEEVSLLPAEAQLKNARAATEAGDYCAAATSYEDAAQLCRASLVGIYNLQASANVCAKRYDDALRASNAAIRIDANNAVASYWKGVALQKMSRLVEAKEAFLKAAALEQVLAKKMVYRECADKCEGEGEVIGNIDATSEDRYAVRPGIDMDPDMEKETNGARKADANTSAVEAMGAKLSSATPAAPVDNTRMQWYQSASHVSIDIYAKNVVKEGSNVSFEKSHLNVRLVRADMQDYELDKELFGDVVVEECTWSASKFKVEIRLKKANAGLSWRALDKEAEVLSAAVRAGAESRRRTKEQKSRDKEWNSLADEELKDYKEGDESMALFRTLYKDADDDVRRAMMKSYSESGGQVLSTNWDEVKKKKVVYEEKKRKD